MKERSSPAEEQSQSSESVGHGGRVTTGPGTESGRPREGPDGAADGGRPPPPFVPPANSHRASVKRPDAPSPTRPAPETRQGPPLPPHLFPRRGVPHPPPPWSVNGGRAVQALRPHGLCRDRPTPPPAARKLPQRTSARPRLRPQLCPRPRPVPLCGGRRRPAWRPAWSAGRRARWNGTSEGLIPSGGRAMSGAESPKLGAVRGHPHSSRGRQRGQRAVAGTAFPSRTRPPLPQRADPAPQGTVGPLPQDGGAQGGRSQCSPPLSSQGTRKRITKIPCHAKNMYFY